MLGAEGCMSAYSFLDQGQSDSLLLERLSASSALMLLTFLPELPQDAALTLTRRRTPQHPQTVESWMTEAQCYGLCLKQGRTTNNSEWSSAHTELILALQWCRGR